MLGYLAYVGIYIARGRGDDGFYGSVSASSTIEKELGHRV